MALEDDALARFCYNLKLKNKLRFIDRDIG